MSVARLHVGQLFSIHKGRKPAVVFSEPTSGATRLLQINDLRGEGAPLYTMGARGVSVEPQDVVIAWDGANAGTVGFNLEGTAGSTLAVLRPISDRVYPAFVGRFLQSRFSLLNRSTDGAAVPHLNRRILESMAVPLPPLAEQRRIAAMFDRADAMRRKRRESLRLLGELLRSAFLEMFGDPVRNEKGWQTRALCAISEVERGRFTPRPRNDPQFYGGDQPFIQTGDIANSAGVLDTWRQTLNEKGAAISRKFPKGTIAIAIAANIGDTAIVEFDFFCPDSVVGIVPKADVLPGYLEYALRFFKPVLLVRAPMTAQRNINLGVLRPLRVPVPPAELQQRFHVIRHAVARMSARLRVSGIQLESLTSSIAQRAFSKDGEA